MDTTPRGAEPTAPLADADAPPPVELQADIFNLACAKRRAYSLGARARLIGVDRGTLDRWYKQPVAVPLDLAMHVARILDLTVEQLWHPVAVAA